MAVTIYRSTDTGAPSTMPASTPAYLSANYMLDLLKAVLLTGYGSKASAGWSLVYENTTVGKRRMALSNGNGVIEFVTWGSGLAVFLWDEITAPGSGAVFVDPYATMLSTGINGWQHERVPALNNSTAQIAGIACGFLVSSNQSTTAWTIHADDKSIHVYFHYPIGNASVSPGTSVGSSKQSEHPVFFFGALKSPDLLRNSQGNMFFAYGKTGVATQSNPTSGWTSGLGYFWGLRTPSGALPSSANSSTFTIQEWQALNNPTNPMSSIRPIIPVIISYSGNDVVRPVGLAVGSAFYSFATLPGVGQFSQEGQSVLDFWQYFTGAYSTTWTLEPHNIGGIQWIPRALGQSAADRNQLGITDQADWWA